jgi:hypothetical protein
MFVLSGDVPNSFEGNTFTPSASLLAIVVDTVFVCPARVNSNVYVPAIIRLSLGVRAVRLLHSGFDGHDTHRQDTPEKGVSSLNFVDAEASKMQGSPADGHAALACTMGAYGPIESA